MQVRHRVAVVVPAYNEASLIGEALSAIPSWVDDIVVVDDASGDDTGAIARSSDPRVRVLRHAHNRGVGAAIATGYEAAFAAGARCAIVMAGDAQMDPADLRAVAEPVLRGDADYVKGDRLSHPDARRVMPLTRYLGNRALSLATRLAFDASIRDSQCGYTALSAGGAAKLPLDSLWPRYGYPNDILGHALDAGLRVREVVVRPIYGREKSGIRVWDGLFVIPYVIARAATRRSRAGSVQRSWQTDVEPAR